MAPIKFLLALSSLAIFSCSLGPTFANAMSIDNHIVNRRIAHDSLVKKERLARRCKQRASPPQASSSSPEATYPSSSPSPQAAVPSSSSSSSSPSPSPTTSTTTTSGTKLGLAWGGAPDSLSLLTGKAKFLYNWSPTAPSNAQQLGFTFVPQLWGYNSIAGFNSYVADSPAGYVLAMNEPNEAGQAYMSYQDGVQLWREYIEPLKAKGYQLGLPATSSNPDGFDWVTNFVNACPDCTFDFVPIHWYDVNFADFQTYVEKWHDKFQKPIWITEYACQNFNGGAQPSAGDIWNFHVQAANWLKTVDYVEMAAPYGFMDTINIDDGNRLLSSDGNSLTALGQELVNIFNS